MLSVCIPIFNEDVRNLTNTLLEQAAQEDIELEILIYDDGSRSEYKKLNSSLSSNKAVKYLEFKENQGCALMRNRMAKDASFNTLLFIDSDSGLPDDFLKVYKPLINSDFKVVSGGRVHPSKLPSKEYSLRWYTGKKREDFNASKRSEIPNSCFMSNNFLIKKSVFDIVSFNPEIPYSGYEDIIFGIELEKKNITIKHIDNSLVHLGLETNDEFIAKTKQRMRTLKYLANYYKDEPLMYKRIKILRYYMKFKKLGLNSFLKFAYISFNKLFERNLKSTKPSLFIYDIYKITFYSYI